MGNAPSSDLPNIPPAPGGGRGSWADAYRQGFADGQAGRPQSPPKDPNLASAYLQGYANGQTVAQEAEARARRALHALGLTEEAKSYRSQQELAGPPQATAPVRVGRAKGAR